MTTISYSQFSRLRLRQFLPPSAEIVEHDGFEWMNGTWKYEGVGFTWFGRLETSPSRTAGLELNFLELSKASLKSILSVLQLPVQAGMKLKELRSLLGEPLETEVFVSDRKTHVFALGKRSAFRVACTVHNRRGLMHISMIRGDVFRRLDAA